MNLYFNGIKIDYIWLEFYSKNKRKENRFIQHETSTTFPIKRSRKLSQARVAADEEQVGEGGGGNWQALALASRFAVFVLMTRRRLAAAR